VNELIINLPDDFHVHLRQGDETPDYAKDHEAHFNRIMVMPNTLPPIRSAESMLAYYQEIKAAAPSLNPLMTFKLHPDYTPEQLRALKEAGAIAGKYYPQGVTTNSEDGVREMDALFPVFAEMEKLGIVLSLHGEEPSAFCIDRERVFIKKMEKIWTEFPKLKIVLEHVSTLEAIELVKAAPAHVAATITVHHMCLTLNDLMGGALKPHYFCKPVVQGPQDRKAILNAACSGNPKFFFGSDSAPHLRHRKEQSVCAAGIYTAPVAMAVLMELFEEQQALDKLENFCSGFGADFYGLPRETSKKLRLIRQEWTVAEEYHGVVPLYAGRTLGWKAEKI
jgi:dihydroorotase